MKFRDLHNNQLYGTIPACANLRTLQSLYCALCSVLCALCSVLCALCSVLRSVATPTRALKVTVLLREADFFTMVRNKEWGGYQIVLSAIRQDNAVQAIHQFLDVAVEPIDLKGGVAVLAGRRQSTALGEPRYLCTSTKRKGREGSIVG